VLCWRAGRRSPIHDHCGSSCAVRVLDGVATETAFALTGHGLVSATASAGHACGGFIGSFDADAHQIPYLQPPGQDLITLHVHPPPLLRMNRYSLTDARVEKLRRPDRVLCRRCRRLKSQSEPPGNAAEPVA
jgi:cysteine dioxygenase